jgi:hypothetical protein
MIFFILGEKRSIHSVITESDINDNPCSMLFIMNNGIDDVKLVINIPTRYRLCASLSVLHVLIVYITVKLFTNTISFIKK